MQSAAIFFLVAAAAPTSATAVVAFVALSEGSSVERLRFGAGEGLDELLLRFFDCLFLLSSCVDLLLSVVVRFELAGEGKRGEPEDWEGMEVALFAGLDGLILPLPFSLFLR